MFVYTVCLLFIALVGFGRRPLFRLRFGPRRAVVPAAAVVVGTNARENLSARILWRDFLGWGGRGKVA